MVNQDKVEGPIRHLRQYLIYLRELASITETQFLTDPHAIGSARYYLTVAIEACLDIAGHLIASEGLRAPHDYKDTFRVLNEAGILPNDATMTIAIIGRSAKPVGTRLLGRGRYNDSRKPAIRTGRL